MHHILICMGLQSCARSMGGAFWCLFSLEIFRKIWLQPCAFPARYRERKFFGGFQIPPWQQSFTPTLCCELLPPMFLCSPTMSEDCSGSYLLGTNDQSLLPEIILCVLVVPGQTFLISSKALIAQCLNWEASTGSGTASIAAVQVTLQSLAVFCAVWIE